MFYCFTEIKTNKQTNPIHPLYSNIAFKFSPPPSLSVCWKRLLLLSAPHGTQWAPAGRREDPGRRAVHLFIGRSPEAHRTAPDRYPYCVFTGALRLHSTNFHRAPPRRRRICDHTRRRNVNPKRNENRLVLKKGIIKNLGCFLYTA